MSQLNVVHLDARKILIFNNLYIIHDNIEKIYSGKMCWISLQETDWLTGYFRITRLCYCQRFQHVEAAEAYFLSSNRASNITTLKAKVLSPDTWYKHVPRYLAYMFLKIIHRSEANYLCRYQKRSYTESIRRSFST